MEIRLSDHFTYKKLLRFTFPSIIMMIFTSIYGIVDGFFVSNFVGKTPFAAVNFIMPVLMMLGVFGFMMGTGGSALVGKSLGEGNLQKANELFSQFVGVTFVFGVVIAAAAFFAVPWIVTALGADSGMKEYCVTYGRIIALSVPAFMLQTEFQSFFVTAEKPRLGLWTTVAAGVTNMVLDALFMGVFHWNVEGAAIATALSQTVGAVIPLVYFFGPNKSLLRLGRFRFDGKAMGKAVTNGSSEMMNNLSVSLVNVFFNAQLMHYIGEDGVSAYGVLMYVCFIFIATFIGYSIGTAPIISYHFGAKNHAELHSIKNKSLVVIAVVSVAMTGLSLATKGVLSSLFVGYDESLCALTERAFTFCSFSFLLSGFNIFLSGFFTALNDGVTSAAIAFVRTLVFQIAAVLILPLIWQADGIWMTMVVAEFGSVILSFTLLAAKRKKYRY